MQYTTILSVLSMAVAASALPNPTNTSSCNAGQVVACCDSINNKGVGINCLASTLPILNTVCLGGQSVACCSPSSGVSLVNAQCINVNVL